jgi:hypothetical protein
MRIITALMLWAVMGTAGASACYQVWDRDGSLVYRGSSIPVDLSWPPVGDSLDRIRQGGMHLVMGRSAQCSPVLLPAFESFVDARDRAPAVPVAIPPTARAAPMPAEMGRARDRQASAPPMQPSSAGRCPAGQTWVAPLMRGDDVQVSGHCRRDVTAERTTLPAVTPPPPQTTRQAQTPSTASSGQCPPGSHWVRPYNRRDGTSVSGHCRRS